MFAGHIKVLGGPHVARGPDVAQAWSRGSMKNQKSKELYPFVPLLQELRGPPEVRNNTLNIHGNYFDF